MGHTGARALHVVQSATPQRRRGLRHKGTGAGSGWRPSPRMDPPRSRRPERPAPVLVNVVARGKPVSLLPHPPARTRADVPAVSRDEHHGGIATAGVAHVGGLVPLGLPAPPGQRLRCRSVPPAGGRTADGACTRPSRGLSGMPGNVHVQFGGQGAGGIPLP